MKWLLLALMFVPGAAFAGGACEATCADTVKQCKDMCKTALKKDAPDKVSFCQDKCKEFENECKKDCEADKKSR